MEKFNVPKRKFCTGPKKLMSWRLPKKLLKELDAMAQASGWNTTDLVTTALDQYAQWERKAKKSKK